MNNKLLKESISISFKYFLYKKIILKLWRNLNPSPEQYIIYSNDVISLGPIFFNGHEPHIVGVIKNFAEFHYGRFFLDIGANIGLISYAVHHYFDYLEAVEPNPACLFALKKNFEIIGVKNYLINEFALDDCEGKISLMVPKNNMGGAFKLGKNNNYNKSQLAAKDGFKFFNENNYKAVSVNTVSSDKYFKDFFARMGNENKRNGIIKIDVEGMELSIIRKIGSAIPRDFSVVIIFENLIKTIDTEVISNYFLGRKVTLYSFDKSYKKYRTLKKMYYFIMSIFKMQVIYSLTEIKSDIIYSSDLILKIE